MPGTITVRNVRSTLSKHQFRHANEAELEVGIAQVLTDDLGLHVERQVRISAKDRIDLRVLLPRQGEAPLRLGIEVKIKGDAGAVRRQLVDYTESDAIDALMLVTTMHRHTAEIFQHARPGPTEGLLLARWRLNGMPFEAVLMRRGFL
jgi:hypothetical protein